MLRFSPTALSLLTAAALAGAAAIPAPAAAAKDPACKATQWNLALPAGVSDQTVQIIDSAENRIWRVGVGSVPASVMLVIEYGSTVGTSGELVLQSGAAQFVEGARVSMHLRRMSGNAKVAVAGTYQLKC